MIRGSCLCGGSYPSIFTPALIMGSSLTIGAFCRKTLHDGKDSGAVAIADRGFDASLRTGHASMTKTLFSFLAETKICHALAREYLGRLVSPCSRELSFTAINLKIALLKHAIYAKNTRILEIEER